MNVDEFIDTWDAMLVDPSIWQGAVELTSDKAVDVNKAQLMDGLGNTGEPLPMLSHYDIGNGTYYDDIKKAMNPLAGGRYDMNWSGYSFSTMRGYFEGERFKIVGEGWAAAYHRGSVLGADEVAGKIYGLYENDHMQYYRTQYLYPLIIQLIKALTGVQ